jgi:hypothetical protein
VSLSLAGRLLAVSPSIFAFLFCALSPEMTSVAKWRIGMLMTDAAEKTTEGTAIPPHQTKKYIEQYLEYTVDISQFLPGFLLPVVTVLASLHLGLSLVTGAVVLIVAVVAFIMLLICVLRADPVTYVRAKPLGRYTILSLVWMVINAATAIWIGVAL